MLSFLDISLWWPLVSSQSPLSWHWHMVQDWAPLSWTLNTENYDLSWQNRGQYPGHVITSRAIRDQYPGQYSPDWVLRITSLACCRRRSGSSCCCSRTCCCTSSRSCWRFVWTLKKVLYRVFFLNAVCFAIFFESQCSPAHWMLLKWQKMLTRSRNLQLKKLLMCFSWHLCIYMET